MSHRARALNLESRDLGSSSDSEVSSLGNLEIISPPQVSASPSLGSPVNSLPAPQGCAGVRWLKAVGGGQLRISGVEGLEAGHDRPSWVPGTAPWSWPDRATLGPLGGLLPSSAGFCPAPSPDKVSPEPLQQVLNTVL